MIEIATCVHVRAGNNSLEQLITRLREAGFYNEAIGAMLEKQIYLVEREQQDNLYRTEDTPHEDMRLVFFGDEYEGYYNPLLPGVI